MSSTPSSVTADPPAGMPTRVVRRLVALLALLVASAAAAAPAAALPPGPSMPFAFDDPGSTGSAGGWRSQQWALTGTWGVRAQGAWEHAAHAGRPGADGTVVAVLDSGVAYRDAGRHRRSPDLEPRQFVAGFDALRGGRPLDPTGHGTHVASAVAARPGNGTGLVGLAYGARIMPVRVLDERGEGRPEHIAAGLRWAARNGADVIALSFAFDPEVAASELRDVQAALHEAHLRGVVVVAAAGNDGRGRVALPARFGKVVAVGATTAGGCGSESSNYGERIDLVAPGGGDDADVPGDERCRPGMDRRRGIAQLGFRRPGRLRVLERDGTSHAVPLVAATAALVLASGVLGPDPSPEDVRRRLRDTARDIGEPGDDVSYGAGLLDAAAATAPRS